MGSRYVLAHSASAQICLEAPGGTDESPSSSLAHGGMERGSGRKSNPGWTALSCLPHGSSTPPVMAASTNCSSAQLLATAGPRQMQWPI